MIGQTSMDALSSDSLAWMTAIIFGLTYLFLAIGKVPRLRIDRAGIALVGAAAHPGPADPRPRPGGTGGGRADDRAPLRHDDRGGVRPPLRVLHRRRRRDREPTPEPARTPGDDDRAVGRALRIPRQRRGLRRDDAAGAGPLPPQEPAAVALPDRPGDRLEHRVGRHDHRQSAEYHHRKFVEYQLRAVRRAAGAGGGDRAGRSTSSCCRWSMPGRWPPADRRGRGVSRSPPSRGCTADC